ncbi:glycoside hydrolase family 3 N-terminal domain-containing protein [Henriciella sp. AS95]|uniref:glycoside hydrolase family 3 protein n=1 Tax=Henriciella sp. AS95 TaxID=3135782 RepID=UPI00317864D0
MSRIESAVKQRSSLTHNRLFRNASLMALFVALASCQSVPEKQITDTPDETAETTETPDASQTANASPSDIHPELWPSIETPPLDPAIEARIDEILPQLTLEQKVGQVIQADSGSVTPEEVKQYRLGSVLSGGNSAPGDKPYADAATWLAAADAYYNASIDPEGVEIAIPVIWGIDAVHGHANLLGATVFPHNVGLGATHNPELIGEIASATAQELNISGHDWTFAPTLAVPQNDRWGRTYEGFSEAPSIVASYSAEIVNGLQGKTGAEDFMDNTHVISSAKHYLADGGTENGIDQGDALISEAELRDIHAAGYAPAVESGVLSVMASFSAWQGVRMHGNKDLLTDVLKDRMNFNGFVVGDWNGHALIKGCTATDCPQALNAGLDMYMAPDSWRGLYESTLEHVKSGVIPMDRLDDAVRRILRVKLAAGTFEKGAPSTRPLAGDLSQLGSADHRALARQAVRESLVLLKNNDGVLPLDTNQTVLVVGPGADSIAKASGGWTLSWQGAGHSNDEFPGGQSILSGITNAVSEAGGDVIFSPDASADVDADVVIAIYGEDPYAEFRGDLPNVDFMPNDFDPEALSRFRDAGTPVVSVFLSGRPLWTNPEINISDAFVAAWLPGSEGGGVADILFQTDPNFDFTGRLSYSWPKLASQNELNAGKEPYDPLFPLGYGLSYDDDGTVGPLSEDSGIDESERGDKGVFLTNGAASVPWGLMINGTQVDAFPFTLENVEVSSIDHTAQEDALQIGWSGPGVFAIGSYGQDFSRESNGALELAFNAVSRGGPASLEVGMGCDAGEGNDEDCAAFLPVELTSEWQEIRLSLSCFADRGVNMESLDRPLILMGTPGQTVGISEVRLATDTNGRIDCGS